ncbi:hypothetical protein HDU91_001574 [Kappamyces sp. JEL0680]|nr:hypothetical protein HDU91_001574 [Kappamyces sp. JEL0680]
MIFDSFIASAGTGISVREQRKNCQVNVNLNYPSGYSYSIVQVDFRGYVQLAEGVTATQSANYYFSGQQTQASSSVTFKGLISQDYQTTGSIPISSINWSPCGQVLPGNINAQVALTGSPQALAVGSQITVDSLDGKVTQIYALQWKKC